MGVVFKAFHPELKRSAAVKRLLAGKHAHERDRVRFLAEAEAMAAIQHPHVAAVYDFGTDDDQPYLAMEYLDGGTLHAKLDAAGKLAPTVAACLVAQIADGVQAAHEAGIVHRDLKPGNVLLDATGAPKVTDFGLAKRGDSGDTASQAVMGTVGYMAPEQARGQTKRAGPAADVYALGAILFRCLAGRPPFEGDDLAEVLLRVIDEDAPSVSSLNAAVPRDLALIVAKCLEKESAHRYPSAAALAADLRRFVAHEPVSVRPIGLAERVVKWIRRRPYLAGLTLALVLSLFVGTLATSALALLALRQKERAISAANDAQAAAALAEERERQATAEAVRANQVADALAGVFRSSDPIDIFTDGLAPPPWETQRTKTAEQLLRSATDQFRTTLTDQPLARGRLLGTAGICFRNLGLVADARPLLVESLDLRRQTLPADHPEVADAELQLGRLDLEAGDYPTALTTLTAAAARLERAKVDERQVLTARLFEGCALALLGRDSGIDRLRMVLEGRIRLDGPTSSPTLMARLALVAVLLELGRVDDAVQQIPAISTALQAQPPGQIRSLCEIMAQFQVGVMMALRGGSLPPVLRIAERQLAAADAAVSVAMPTRNVYRAILRCVWGQVLSQLDRGAEAEIQWKACLDDVRATCGLAHPKAHLPIRLYAERLAVTGRHDQAVALYAEAEAATKARYGSGSNVEALLLLGRAEFEADRRQWIDAAATTARALALSDKLVPTRTAWTATHEAAIAMRNGPTGVTSEPTLRLFRLAHHLATTQEGPSGARVFISLRDKADELRQAGQHRKAEAAIMEAEAIMVQRSDTTPRERNILLVYRGRLEVDRGDFSAAEQAYRAAAELSKEFTGRQAADRAEDLRDLAGTLADQGKLAEAEATLATALTITGLSKRRVADLRRRQAAVRRAQGKPADQTDPRVVRMIGLAVAGGLATPRLPQQSADDGFPFFNTDWLDRLPLR